jgi:UDP-glucose 6-dehydrogenase
MMCCKGAGGADWREFIAILAADPRMGASHMQIPGKDGLRGYAGSCFPKDTAALAYFAREIINRPFTQLETSIRINDTLERSTTARQEEAPAINAKEINALANELSSYFAKLAKEMLQNMQRPNTAMTWQNMKN